MHTAVTACFATKSCPCIQAANKCKTTACPVPTSPETFALGMLLWLCIVSGHIGVFMSRVPKSLNMFVCNHRQASKFKLPRVRRNRQMVCFTDAEFGRQYLAGQNPCIVQQVTPEWLEATSFTSKSIGGASTTPERNSHPYALSK